MLGVAKGDDMPGTARISWFVAVGLLFSGCATGGVRAQSRPLEDIFDGVRDAVVTIKATSRAITRTGKSKLAAAAGVGSGVLVSADGDIMTAAHYTNRGRRGHSGQPHSAARARR